MNTRPAKLSKFFSLTLILFILLGFAVSFSVSCGSSAAAKKEKAKKKKAAADEETDEESSKDSAENSEENPADSENEEAKEDEKKSSKANEKSKNTKSASEKEKDKKAEEAPPKPEDIWAELMQGNKRFVAGQHTIGKLVFERKELAKGQHPHVIILGCADSRVPPELLFDKNLGELFVVRAAGNVADPVELGSIEYAVEHLHSSVLVVLGHESCGAVAAAVSGEKMPSKNLNAIVSKIIPAFENEDSCVIGEKLNSSCIRLNVKQSAEDVLQNSPILEEAVKEGKLSVIRAVYDLESGKVERLK